MLEPSGAGIWATPTLDVKRRRLYVTTGNAFSGAPRTANAVMAFDMDNGKVLWSMQALPFDTWHNGCVQNIPGARSRGVPEAQDVPVRPPVQAAPDVAAHVAVEFRIQQRTAPACSAPTGISRRRPQWRRRRMDATF